MGFAGARERLNAAVFARLGEDATWQGVAGTVKVRRREYDEDARFGDSSEILTVRSIRVARSAVAAPSEGDEVQILDDEGAPIEGALYRVHGDPQLDRAGIWTCPVELA